MGYLCVCVPNTNISYPNSTQTLNQNKNWITSPFSFFKQHLRRVLANGPRDWGSIIGRVITKTQKMVLDAALLNTQHYKVSIKGKWSNPGKKLGSPLHLGVVAIDKGAFGLPSTKVANFTYLLFSYLQIYFRHLYSHYLLKLPPCLFIIFHLFFQHLSYFQPTIRHYRHHTSYITEPPTVSTIFLTLSHYKHKYCH